MRTQFIAALLFMVSILVSGQLARAQQSVRQRPDPRDLDWRQAAKTEGLTADELRLLEQNKFVIGGKEYKQVFQPYLGGSVPVFITSDSLLNAYHVLLEGSLKHVEHAQAVRLCKLLPGMWKGLEGPDKDAAGDSAIVKSARRRARIVLGTAMKGCKTEVAPLWQSMALTCRRLEALSQKQLRGVAFTAEEDQFIKGYGEELAAYMLYFGESYENPRDDAPRVADVFMNPRQGKLLEIGIGRAKSIYVLYPWQGREILCRGAVMPYYEFTHERPMNDGEWKALLDSPQRPNLPHWVKPIYGSPSDKK